MNEEAKMVKFGGTPKTKPLAFMRHGDPRLQIKYDPFRPKIDKSDTHQPPQTKKEPPSR